MKLESITITRQQYRKLMTYMENNIELLEPLSAVELAKDVLEKIGVPISIAMFSDYRDDAGYPPKQGSRKKTESPIVPAEQEHSSLQDRIITLTTQSDTLDAHRNTLDARCDTLDAHCDTLEAHCDTLEAQCDDTLKAQCDTLKARCYTLVQALRQRGLWPDQPNET